MGSEKSGTPEASREVEMRLSCALSRSTGKVGERPVGFGHAVGLLTHADGFAFVAGSIPEPSWRAVGPWGAPSPSGPLG